MVNRSSRKIAAAIGIIGVASAGIFVGSATASQSGKDVQYALHGGYEENRDGLRFGSLADEQAVGAPPDLILVANSEGIEGYIHRDDLDALAGPEPSSPDEAAVIEANRSARLAELGSLTIAMYESDGETYIGEWDGFNRSEGGDDAFGTD